MAPSATNLRFLCTGGTNDIGLVEFEVYAQAAQAAASAAPLLALLNGLDN